MAGQTKAVRPIRLPPPKRQAYAVESEYLMFWASEIDCGHQSNT